MVLKDKAKLIYDIYSNLFNNTIKHLNNKVINENKVISNKASNVLHEAVAADGTEYGIVQEEKHVYIKSKNTDGEYDYLTGVQNIHEHSYKSYADALAWWLLCQPCPQVKYASNGMFLL